MKKVLVVFFLLFVGIAGAYYLRHPLGAKVKIGQHIIPVELAVTETEKQKGLGFRDSLKPNAGMLFVYNHKEQYNYWMRGMRFPIDFIWIDGKIIVDITPSIPPPSGDEQLKVYKPKVPVDKILEVNAGTVERVGISIGDTVSFLD